MPRREEVAGARGTVLALEGPSGTGKSTVAAALARELGASILPEAYERLRPRPSLAFAGPRELLGLERALLDEEGQRYREARRAAADGRTIVADTGFLGPLTYTLGLVVLGRAPRSVLDRLLARAGSLARAGRWGLPDRIVLLRTTSADRRRRTSEDPIGHPVAYRERHEAVGAVERRWYSEELGPLLGERIRSVPAEDGPQEVARRVARWMERSPTGPAPPDRVRPVLDRLSAFADRRAGPGAKRPRGNR